MGQDVEVLVTAIKRTQVLGRGARNIPTRQPGSEAAFPISMVGTFLFLCVSQKGRRWWSVPLHHGCPQLPAAAAGLKLVTPTSLAPSYQSAMFGLRYRF